MLLDDKIKHSYAFGVIDKDSPGKERIKGKELFPENLNSSTTVKSIKLWFGPVSTKRETNALLGIQVKYINYITGIKKETEYQGAKLDETDIQVQTLDINEGDYLSKINIGFDEYINHIKFTTMKGKFIEMGTIIENNEKNSVNDINSGKNIILNIKGYYNTNAIRALGCDYISFKDFCFIRWIDLLRLRFKLKNKECLQKFENDYKNYKDDGIKCIFRTCKLADGCFATILKYL